MSTPTVILALGGATVLVVLVVVLARPATPVVIERGKDDRDRGVGERVGGLLGELLDQYGVIPQS